MKLTPVIVVLSVSLAATLDAASSEQSQSETVSNPSQAQLWTNSERLEGLKDIVFDFDTHESASGGSVGLQAGGEHQDIVLLMNAQGEQELKNGALGPRS
jgi:maltose-binding protein MalE